MKGTYKDGQIVGIIQKEELRHHEGLDINLIRVRHIVNDYLVLGSIDGDYDVESNNGLGVQYTFPELADLLDSQGTIPSNDKIFSIDLRFEPLE